MLSAVSKVANDNPVIPSIKVHIESCVHFIKKTKQVNYGTIEN